jgi:hypothetical protein
MVLDDRDIARHRVEPINRDNKGEHADDYRKQLRQAPKE